MSAARRLTPVFDSEHPGNGKTHQIRKEIRFDDFVREMTAVYFSCTNLPKGKPEFGEIREQLKADMSDPGFDLQAFLNRHMQEFIRNDAALDESPPKAQTVMISGRLDEQSLFESFRPLLDKYDNDDLELGETTRRGRAKLKHLVVQIDVVEDGCLDFLEAFLFQLIALRMVRLNGHIRFLPYDTRVKFELSHSQSFRLRERLPVLRLASHCAMQFSLDLFDYDGSTNSELQTVTAFLDQIELNRNVGDVRVSRIRGIREGLFDSNFRNTVQQKDSDSVRELLHKYFLEPCKQVGFRSEMITFAHLDMFLRIVCKEFLSWNLLIKARGIKDKRQTHCMYLSSIRSTLLCIMPFADSVRVQHAAFDYSVQDRYTGLGPDLTAGRARRK